MRKGVLLLIFTMIFTMIVPAQASTMPQSMLPEKTVSNDINGSYVVSVKVGDDWNKIGSLNFGKNPSTEIINVGSYLIGNNPIIKLSQDGGGSAYLDAIFLDGTPAIKANYDEGKVLNKLSKEDLDITPVGEEGIVLEFSNYDKDGILTVVGRIEPVVIGKEPLQFPVENNYKSKDDVEDFYSYTLGSNRGTLKVDGVLNEVSDMEPFVKEYRVNGSGHPESDVYFWVMNDYENLYVTMDVTPDNTYDGDKDYAKVYVNTDEGIKEFKVSVPETTWGNTVFTYTDKVGYEHKVYEFAIPLYELNSDNSKELNIAFVVYGTLSLVSEYYQPALAYDLEHDVYISVFEVFEYVDEGEYNRPIHSYIYGELINNKGVPIEGSKKVIAESATSRLYTPDIVYGNNEYMIVWSQDNDIIYTRAISIDGNTIITEGESLPVSNDDINYRANPKISYDNKEEKYLTVWEEATDQGIVIKGQFIKGDNTLFDLSFDISDENNMDNTDPSICYSTDYESFLVVWKYDDSTYNRIKARVVKSKDTLYFVENLYSGNKCGPPDVKINKKNNCFFVTYSRGGKTYGGYYRLDIEPNLIRIVGIISEFKISTDASYYNEEYPSSYYDGFGSMLCVWGSNIADDPDIYARLSYVNDMRYVGEPFYTDEQKEDRDSIYLYNSRTIAITGNNNGNNLIAYELKGNNDIGYRLFGKGTTISSTYIKFNNTPFTVDVNSKPLQANVYLFNSLNQNGFDITNNGEHKKSYFSEDNDVAIISNTGEIKGISKGETIVHVYYASDILDEELPFFPMVYAHDSAIVKVTESIPVEPTLIFDKDTYTVEIGGSTYQTTVNYFDGLTNHPNITESVEQFSIGDPNIATISSGGAITALAVGRTTISAIYLDCTATAALIVNEKITPPPSPSGGGSSTPARTPIGQILVDNKVIKTLYEEDVINKNNTYTFTADKIGKSAKLWLESGFYDNLAEDYPNRIIKFNWDKGTYTLPLNCDEVLKEIDSSAKKINILIEKIDDKEIIEAAKDSAEKMGAEIISELIDFSVYIEKSKGTTDIESLDFYAIRTINELDEISESISTAMKFVENKEALTFAPSVFDDDFVTVKYRGNGIFTVIENPQTFNDILSHWAKVNIEKLATRNIAFGRENNSFAPNDFVTRAEFAVMITRALGITEEEGSNDFTDVTNEWFAEDIGTAFESGLINGRSDGKFYPNEKIQRKDMAVMIQNALEFAGMNFDVSNADSVLSMFKDSSSIADYAREATAFCADAGIIMGRDTKNFDPDQNATRAEASAIIERMLRYLDFVN